MARALAATPLFPLSNVVLFPGVRAPLHVFEPRYRQMTRDALATERRIGMIAVRPEHAAEIDGDPPLFAIGCLGAIVESEALSDGRFNVMLLGTQRFRVVREPPREGERLYRVAEVELLEDDAAIGDAARLHALRRRVVELFRQILAITDPSRARELPPTVFDGVEDRALVNTLSQMLDLPVLEKQGLLEANGLLERCERLCSVLELRAAELAWHGDEEIRTRH
jgi:Lon protease-like protein